MEKLNSQNSGWRLTFVVLVFIIFFLTFIFLSMPLLYEINSRAIAAAVKNCPKGTFFFGRTYASWDSSITAALVVALLFLLTNAALRPPFFPDGFRNRYGMPWKRKGIIAVCMLIIAAAATMCFIDFTTFCLVDSGIYYQKIPNSAFQQYHWNSVRRIEVDCGYGRHGGETSYLLTLNDRTQLNVADALEMPSSLWAPPSAYEEFKKSLDNVEFQFVTNIRPACPKNLANWVGRKP